MCFSSVAQPDSPCLRSTNISYLCSSVFICGPNVFFHLRPSRMPPVSDRLTFPICVHPCSSVAQMCFSSVAQPDAPCLRSTNISYLRSSVFICGPNVFFICRPAGCPPAPSPPPTASVSDRLTFPICVHLRSSAAQMCFFICGPAGCPLHRPRQELHLHLSHLDHIPRLQFDFRHRIPVHQRSIRRIQIPQHEPVALALDHRLRPRHLFVIRKPVIVPRAPPERRR